MEFLNALVALTNFVLVPAVAYGSQLALGALGVTLIYGILRFSNFAHGDTMAFGTMATILVTWWFQSMGIGFGVLPTALLALPFGIAATAALVLATDRTVYRFYRAQKAKPVIFVMVSLGVMFIMNGLVRFIIGPGNQRFADGERFIIKARTFKQMTGLDEGLALKTSQGIAGVLYGLDKSFKPFTYFQLLLPIFAAAIVGGLGNPLGAIAGGFVIAFSEVLVTYAWKKVLVYLMPEGLGPDGLAQLLSTDYKFAVSVMILVVVLLFKPTGLFKGKAV